MRRFRFTGPLLALALMLAAACDLGSRSVTQSFYNLSFESQQVGGGLLTLTGTTDIPDGTDIDVLLTRSATTTDALDQAVLRGTTSSFDSQPIKHGHFTIALKTVLANTCHNLPPCGPFGAGEYRLLIDVITRPDPVGGAAVLDDPRYVTRAHGFRDLAALELFRPVVLAQPISARVLENGRQSVSAP